MFKTFLFIKTYQFIGIWTHLFKDINNKTTGQFGDRSGNKKTLLRVQNNVFIKLTSVSYGCNWSEPSAPADRGALSSSAGQLCRLLQCWFLVILCCLPELAFPCLACPTYASNTLDDFMEAVERSSLPSASGQFRELIDSNHGYPSGLGNISCRAHVL